MSSSLGKIVVVALAAFLAFGVMGIGALMLRNREAAAPIIIVPPEPTATALPTNTPAPIQVYVSGEVLVPDVYALAPGSRIKQLVEAAGGFTDDANKAAVNLAQPLSDGVHVHIPAEDEAAGTPPSVVASPAPLRSSTDIDVGFGGGLVNINTADLQELDTLPGVGPVTAQKILDYRTVNGLFVDIEGIKEVPGIGEGKFDQIKGLITIDNQN